MNKQQNEYAEKLAAQVVDWETQIEHLEEMAETASPELEDDYRNAISSLQHKRDEAAKILKGLSGPSGEWKTLKEGAEQTLNEVQTILTNALSKFRH